MDFNDKVVEFKPAKKPDKKEMINAETGLTNLAKSDKRKNSSTKDIIDSLQDKMNLLQENIEQQTSQNKLLQTMLEEQAKKTGRLTSSLEALIPQIGKVFIRNEEASLRFSMDPDNSDLACYDLKAPSEAKYPLTSARIATQLGIHSPCQVGKLMKDIKIKGDERFHFEFETGTVSRTHKYSLAVINEVFKRLEKNQEFDITDEISEYWKERIIQTTLNQ